MNWFRKSKPPTTTQNREVLKVNVYESDKNNDETKHYCSFVSTDLIFKYGLTSSIILGSVKKSENGEFDFESGFTPNSKFKETIFKFIATEMIKSSGLTEAAKNQQKGYIYIIDQRTPTPNGEVPNFDIMGAFTVENQMLKSFEGNAKYQIKSINGFCDFGKKLNLEMNKFLENLVLTQT